MKRFVEGEDRRQATLLPECLDDYVAPDNPVRIIEAFVDELDLAALGFAGVVPEATGRPAYHPSTLLKIYIYGYLNRVPSSRRLERETQRNLELMWLTGRLMPDFKTIADFRRDNGPAIRAACAQFVVLCRKLNLFTRAVAAIDRADRQDNDVAEARTSRLKEKIKGLRRSMQSLKEMEQQVEATPDQQISLTDPDARSMATSGKGTGVVGYNVQMAVEAEHHLIVAHQVTNVGNDRTQLLAMGKQARAVMACEELTVLADRGYYNGDEVLACEGTGVLPYVPKIQTSGNTNRGLFTGQDFVYDAEHDRYTCPAGQHLTKGKMRSDRWDTIDHYRNLTACTTCALKPRCTPDKHRRVKRWEHEDVLDRMQVRLERMPEAMTIRRQTVEHPFGTVKAWMGSTHFLMKTLEKVRTEMSLHVLAYNLKRMISILGVGPLLRALAA